MSKRNVISTMPQRFIVLGMISLLCYVVGFSLAFGDSIGTHELRFVVEAS